MSVGHLKYHVKPDIAIKVYHIPGVQAYSCLQCAMLSTVRCVVPVHQVYINDGQLPFWASSRGSFNAVILRSNAR